MTFHYDISSPILTNRCETEFFSLHISKIKISSKKLVPKPSSITKCYKKNEEWQGIVDTRLQLEDFQKFVDLKKNYYFFWNYNLHDI